MIQVRDDQKIEFIFDYPCQEQVYLVGDFNDWNEKSHPMECKDGKWKLEIELPPGEYEFKYLVGKIWYNDYAAHKYVPNCWDSENSVVVVEGVHCVS
jgi:1,4-alpha-glucan branching enzyme